MRIAKRMDKLTGFQAAYLRHHHGQQCVAGDVKRYAKENIGAALVKLAGQFAVGNVKLKQCVARRQGHFIDQSWIPCGHNQAARVGIFLDLFHHIGNLVDMATVGCGPAAPLVAVNRAQIAIFIRPFIPNGNVVVFQVFDVGIAFEKPKQLMNNRAQMQFFGSQQRKAFTQIKTHLVTKHGTRAGAGTVGFVDTIVENMAHKVVIGFHVFP